MIPLQQHCNIYQLANISRRILKSEGSPTTLFTQQGKEIEMLACVLKNQGHKNLQILHQDSVLKIPLFLSWFVFAFHNIPYWHFFQNGLSLLAKDVQDSGKGFFSPAQCWVLHRSSRMICHPAVRSPIRVSGWSTAAPEQPCALENTVTHSFTCTHCQAAECSHEQPSQHIRYSLL